MDTPKRQTEVAARAALEFRLQRTLTDAEWAAAGDRLLEFVRILRAWDGKQTASQTETGGTNIRPDRSVEMVSGECKAPLHGPQQMRSQSL